MECTLSIHEVRVLGSLVEKELTTPEYYPLTLNALVNACNQKSNRNPVLNLTPDDVEDAIESLRKKQLVWRRNCAGARVSKYEHNFNVKWDLTEEEVAVMCTLLLRGPQTVGEIRGRCGRMHEFDSLDSVLKVITQLQEKEDGPFIIKLPRQAGCKDNRYMHLLSGQIDITADSNDEKPSSMQPAQSDYGSRIEELEIKVTTLSNELHLLQSQFEQFKNAFE